MSDPYANSDKTAALLNKKAIRRFAKARRDCDLLHIDELNVMKTITQLYKDLASDNRKAFFDLAVMAYQDAQPNGKKDPDRSWILALLDSYDPVALYVYGHEIGRKRDYAIESILAASVKGKEFTRALKYWSRMTAHMTDRVTDEARVKAFKDAGIKRVRWVTERDEKVCPICGPKDGKVYDIDKAPPKPHLRCRCFFEPVL